MPALAAEEVAPAPSTPVGTGAFVPCCASRLLERSKTARERPVRLAKRISDEVFISFSLLREGDCSRRGVHPRWWRCRERGVAASIAPSRSGNGCPRRHESEGEKGQRVPGKPLCEANSTGFRSRLQTLSGGPDAVAVVCYVSAFAKAGPRRHAPTPGAAADTTSFRENLRGQSVVHSVAPTT